MDGDSWMIPDKCPCGAPMVLATQEREFKTYRCAGGCEFYRYIETKKEMKEGTINEKQTFCNASV
jgi:hypothetical protein